MKMHISICTKSECCKSMAQSNKFTTRKWHIRPCTLVPGALGPGTKGQFSTRRYAQCPESRKVPAGTTTGVEK